MALSGSRSRAAGAACGTHNLHMTTTPPTPAPDGHENAVRVAMDWLSDRHRKAWRNASAEVVELLRPDGLAGGHDVDAELTQALAINAGEWLLARGDMFVKGEMRSINEHLLGRDGPYLTPGQQGWIAQLASRPLRLYRVTDVRPGEGLTLVDEIDAQAAPLVVRERSGSRSARPGMLMGARVMHLSDHLELSGAVYAFAPLREAGVIGSVRAALDAGLHPANNLQLAELAIARCWLAQGFEPLPVPEMRDAASGEPMMLVTDHYHVADAAALAAALAAQADVSGGPDLGWHRDVDAGDGMQRSLAAINPGKSADRIEIFYLTQRLADEGRSWFEALAGGAVALLRREVVDPRTAIAGKSAAGHGRSTAGDGKGKGQRGTTAAPAPEDTTALMTQVLRKHYANWPDEPVPLLGKRTPREAIATPAGLERVKGLLRSYESAEEEMARADAREPVSYQFLWDALGISR